ncbi:hypothetical protein GmHk_15G043979 [Glycine max]|nr:hypothetical protein GmHk_15G043979 [Glycine max]
MLFIFFVRIFFHFDFYIALDGKEVNSSAQGHALCPCKALLCSVFILLWTGKRCDLCLIPTRFHGKKANRGAEGDNALLDLIFAIFLFSQETPLFWKTKGVIFIFHHESIPSTLFFLFFPKPNQFFCLIFCGRFLGQAKMLLMVKLHMRR